MPLKLRAVRSTLGIAGAMLALFLNTSAAQDAKTATLPNAPSAVSGPAAPGEPGYAPLTASQRWNRFGKDFLGSPSTYVAAAGAASGGFLSHDPKDPAGEWGRNLGGYGRRVGTEFAIFTIHTGVHEAGDAALGLDPRYFRCRCSGAGARTWNALQFTFLAYDRNGHKRLDLPQFAGAYGATMISRTWYPDHYSPLVQGVQAGHAELGLVFVVNMAREFSPEIKRTLHKMNPLKR